MKKRWDTIHDGVPPFYISLVFFSGFETPARFFLLLFYRLPLPVFDFR
ncbi:hypothetical protein B4098_1312 [Heyndrickxia coagulans]|uniref:Uncharacterized protein n=1 Tax=Heyndrickxia coagulans TaxID=1398 RepID=A0A150KD79_HEYCO|nr:hypothetical protein B4098_1312 [Heyndrickxia coagulans]